MHGRYTILDNITIETEQRLTAKTTMYDDQQVPPVKIHVETCKQKKNKGKQNGQLTLNTPDSVRTKLLATPTKNTAATFNKKATAALLSRTNAPRSLS